MIRFTENCLSSRLLAVLLAIVMVVSVVPISVFAADESTITVDSAIKEATVGTAKEFTYTLSPSANDREERIQVKIDVSGSADGVEKIEYKNSRGNWSEANNGAIYSGPGVTFADSTLEVRITFSKSGIYTVNASVVKRDDTSEVLCSAESVAFVNGSSYITTDDDNKTLVVNEEGEFSITAMANEDAGKVVIGKISVSNADALESLSCKATEDGEWAVIDGQFGDENGVALENDTKSYFKAKFNAVGSYGITVSYNDAESDEVVCVKYFTVNVKGIKAIELSTDFVEITYPNQANAFNSIVNKEDGEEYVFTSNNTNVVEVDAESGNLVPVGLGTATVSVVRKESASYIESESASFTVQVVAGTQAALEWEKEAPGEIEWDDGFSNKVKGEGTVTYTSSNDDIASVDENGKVTMKKPGQVTITAVKHIDNYDDATSYYTLNITKATQSIGFQPNSAEILAGYESYQCPALSNAGAGSGAVTYEIYEQPEEAVADGIDNETGKLTLTGVAGTIVIKATKAEDELYKPASAKFTLVIKYSKATGEEYYLDGPRKNDSGWFTGKVSIKANPGYMVSRKTNKEWGSEIPDANFNNGVLREGEQVQVIIFVKKIGSSHSNPTVTFKVDATDPTASISLGENYTNWDKFLTIITFGKYTPSDTKAKFTVTGEDAISGVASLDYYIDYADAQGNISLLSNDELEADSIAWVNIFNSSATKGETFKKANAEFDVDANRKFIAYVKATDVAGNTSIITNTNVVIYDRTAPEVDFDIITEGVTVGGDTLYNSNVEIALDVDDTVFGSGINTVSYSVLCDGKVTQSGVLYESGVDADDLADNAVLTTSWSSEADNKNIVVDKTLNNSDNVQVEIIVSDNAGANNADAKTVIPLKIFNFDNEDNKPSVDISFTGGSMIAEVGGVEYYDSARTAIIKIESRTSLFNASSKPVVILNGEEYVVNEWVAGKDNSNLDTDTFTFAIPFENSGYYELSVEFTDAFGYSDSYTANKFAVDKEAPNATVSVDGNTWSKLLETITFGLWKNESVEVNISATDAISPSVKIEYFKSNSTERLSADDLEDVEWTEGDSFSVENDEVFVVYVKVTDVVGRVSYICSDGYIIDKTNPGVSITLPETTLKHDDIPVYTDDVTATITVNELANETYSGIKTIEYWVTSNGKETARETLFSFGYDMDDYAAESNNVPVHNELVRDFTEDVVIDSAANNYCDVVIHVQVTDNAGNVTEITEELDIDVTDPTISVSYDNNNANKIVDGKGYFNAGRIATVVITERTAHFNADAATNGIVITAVDSQSKTVIADCKTLISAWTTTEGDDANEATHKATITYAEDANYTFAISYTDLAERSNDGVDTGDSVAPYDFAVDDTDPTATVTVNGNSWSKLADVLTFGLWSNDQFTVTTEAKDETGPVIVEYYKTNSTTALDGKALDAVTEWKAYESITISGDERFTVYYKVTDYSGNYIYVSTDGHIIDKTAPGASITLPATDLKHNDIPVYTDNVTVTVAVNELADETYSGIKTVEYWVTSNGKETAREVLFSFGYDMDDYVAGGDVPVHSELVREFTEDVVINAEENNYCDVVFHVQVTDNAGNVTEISEKLDIDVTDPTISVTYDNNDENKIVDNKGYFGAGRIATVVIAERTAHFNADNATNGIVITAVDSQGKTVIEDCKTLISTWTTVEGGDANAATHTATITYSADANYTFAIDYTDLAERSNDGVDTGDSVAPYEFAVDATAPEASVTADGHGTWKDLIKVLTFGLWNKTSIDITSTSSDATSPLETVVYFKTDAVSALTADDLAKVTDWKEFKDFTVASDEKFTVYLRVTDYAGNVTYVSTNGLIVDKTDPSVDKLAPEITITPDPVYGIYNSDVTFAVSVTDPIVGETKAYSGLKEISYTVTSLGKQTQDGVLYSFTTTDPVHGELKQAWNGNIVVLANEDNNSNEVVVTVKAVDNAGRESTKSYTIKIDITAPKINVSYDNNAGDTTFADSVYFKDNRTATIVVTERNFDPELFEYEVTNTDGYIPVISGWTTVKGTQANGDDTTHTATIVFDRDGDYELKNISCKDAALNKNDKEPDAGTSLAPWAFTIDKTAPTINVAYNNNDAANGNYYKAERTATITIVEHNFETSRIKVMITATDDGAPVAAPVVGAWTTVGDTHTATITYSADARYVFDIEYDDKAMNAAANLAEQVFFVDKTNPTLTIEKIVDASANNDEGDIGFVMTAYDTNFDVFTPVITAVVNNGGKFETKTLEIGEFAEIKNGKIFTVTNIDTDGIYRITCTVVDKAGNAYSEVTLENAEGEKYTEQRAGETTLVEFSVNRDGSVFEIDEATAKLVEQYYVQNVTDDVVIVEINADVLSKYTVTLNGKELSAGTDYEVAEEGGNGNWKKYIYTIDSDLFAEEGEYKIVVSSKDKAENDAFSDVKSANVAFVVDRTAPVVTVSGMANGGRYQTESQTVTVMPTDDGGALSTLVINMVDADGKVIKEVINLSGTELTEALEANEGKITFEIGEGLYQNVQIICTDSATGEGDVTNVTDVTYKNVSVSSNLFMIFWANKPVRWGTIGGLSAAVIALGIFLVLKNKKRKDA